MTRKGTMKRVVAYALSAALFAMGSMSAFAAAEGEDDVTPVTIEDTSTAVPSEDGGSVNVGGSEGDDSASYTVSGISAAVLNDDGISSVDPTTVMAKISALNNGDDTDTDDDAAISNDINVRATQNPQEDLEWTVNRSKSVEITDDDDTYLLKITLEANSQPKSNDPAQNNKLDIVYVVDESGSMSWGSAVDPKDGISKTPIEFMKEAIIELTSEIKDKDKNGDVQFAIVGFGVMDNGLYTVGNTKNDARIITGFGNADTAISKTDDIVALGDTPIDAGLKKVNELFNDTSYGARDDARRVVVVLCDGSFLNKNRAMQAGADLDLNENDIYYGISLNNGNNRLWGNEMENLRDSVDKNHNKVQTYNVEVTSENLAGAFVELVSVIEESYYEYVQSGHMTDVLSEAMDFADDKYSLIITDDSGNPQTLTQNSDGSYQMPPTKHNPKGGTVTVHKKNEGGKESIELEFSKGYQMESGWVFELQAYLRVNPQFAASYDGHIDGKSNAGTGTYALQDGVWTNVNAESLFRFVGSYQKEDDGTHTPEWVELELQKPVIVLNAAAPAAAGGAPAPTMNPAPADTTDDSVYLAPEAPEVLGVTRETIPAGEEAPVVLGARRSVRTVDMTAVLPVFCFMMSGITFLCSRKKDDDNVA